MINLWNAISLLGSMAVMGAAGVAIGVWLAADRNWRLALHWCLLFGIGMALVVATKVAFIGWGIGLSSVEFAGISGHAMRAAAVLPVVFFVILKSASAPVRAAGVVLGVVLALLVSVSRVVVGAHSVSEVVSGSLLGLLVAFAFMWYAGAARVAVVSRTLVLLSMCALLLTPKSEPVPTEKWMTALALHLSGHPHPFERSHWKVAQRPPLMR